LSLLRWLKSYETRHAHALFWSMATLALIRNFYHIYWFLLGVFPLIYGCAGHRRELSKAAAIPSLLLAVVAVKQFMLFGTPIAGTVYNGQNLAQRIERYVSAEDRASLIQTGVVPAYFFVKPFGEYSYYRRYLPPPPTTGVAVLDRELKSNAKVNFNYSGYLALADGYRDGFIAVVLRFPEIYLFSFAPALKYFNPSSDDGPAMGPNRSPGMQTVTRYYNLLFCGQIHPWHVGWWLVIGFPLLILFGAVQTYVRYRDGDRATFGTLAYMLANVLYVTMITVGISIYDYNRYRFKIDVFYLVLLGMASTALLHRLQGISSAASSASPRRTREYTNADTCPATTPAAAPIGPPTKPPAYEP
ncbi:MAG: hypothetical protein ACRD2A_20865, partial [Vicinamibacterales bacterium]